MRRKLIEFVVLFDLVNGAVSGVRWVLRFLRGDLTPWQQRQFIYGDMNYGYGETAHWTDAVGPKDTA